MRRCEGGRSVDDKARVCRAELVLRMAREPPVQPRMDYHEHVEAEHRPEPCALIGVRGEPQEHGEERDVDEDERAAGRLVGHRAQDEEQPPLVLVHGVEFVGDEPREREVEQEVGSLSHKRSRVAERGITLGITRRAHNVASDKFSVRGTLLAGRVHVIVRRRSRDAI